jgi:hypothetical protein
MKTFIVCAGLVLLILSCAAGYVMGRMDGAPPPCDLCNIKDRAYANISYKTAKHVHGIELDGVPVQGSTNLFQIILTHPTDGTRNLKIWGK